MWKDLNSVVDVKIVALSVANYGHTMFLNWMNKTSNWKNEIHKAGLRWDTSWNANSSASFYALDEWINKGSEEVKIQPCRHALSWS